MFDQNEDGAGELYDAATGQPIDNSSYDGLEMLRVIDPMLVLNDGSEDLLGPVIE